MLQAPPRTKAYRTHLIGWTITGAIVCTILVNLVPPIVPPGTAADFFLAASGVNATILVAISVTISSIVRQQAERAIPGRTALFVAQLSVVFVGMVASGLGILLFNPDVAFDSLEFRVLAGLVLVTWVLGFMLLVIGVEASVFPEAGQR